MDFQLSRPQQMLKRMVREFAERELKPKAAYWDERDEFPSENIAKLRQAGLLGLTVPTQYGGQGQGVLELVLVMEEIARVCPATAFLLIATTSFGVRILETFCSEESRQKYLPKVCSGELRMVWGMTEPDAGSDTGSIRTMAVPKGDHYVLQGHKAFCSGATVADLAAVVARIGNTPGLEGLGVLLVDKGTSGFSTGKAIRTMGLRGTGMGDLLFDECTVPQENLLLGPGEFRKLFSVLNTERVAGNPSMSVGIAQAALEEAIRYSRGRVQFGRPIGDFQGIRWMLAETAMKVEAARLLVYRAAANAAGGFPSAYEASLAKAYANQAAVEAANVAMELHGAYGYTREAPVERMLRDARGLCIGDGTIEIQKNLIGAQLIRKGLPMGM